MLRSLSVFISAIALSAITGTQATQAQGARGGQNPQGGTQAPQPNQRDLVLEGQQRPATPADTSVPRGWAVVIGVGSYQNLDEARQLKFAESDADSVYRVLISHEGGAFPAENVHLLKGRQATLANIRKELEEWLPSVAGANDRVVVFFAGHGFVKGRRGFLAGT